MRMWLMRTLGFTRWIPCSGRIEQEDEDGMTLIVDTPEGPVRIRNKKGDYRIKEKGVIEVRVGSRAEWFDPPLSCKIKD